MSLGRSKKPCTAPMEPDAWRALADMSKAALMDCLADALVLLHGGESASPSPAAARSPDTVTLCMVADHCNPRLRVRGDDLVREGSRLPGKAGAG